MNAADEWTDRRALESDRRPKSERKAQSVASYQFDGPPNKKVKVSNGLSGGHQGSDGAPSHVAHAPQSSLDRIRIQPPRKAKMNAAPSKPKGLNYCNVFVGNAGSLSKGDLRELFHDFNVLNVKFAADPQTNTQLGWAQVKLQSLSEAQQAVIALNGSVLKGTGLQGLHMKLADEEVIGQQSNNTPGSDVPSHVSNGRAGCRLRIGNLPHNASKADLKGLLTDHMISHISIPSIPFKKQPSRFGFVELVQASDAENVIAKLNGTLLKGKSISVRVAGDGPPETRSAIVLEQEARDLEFENEALFGEREGHEPAPPIKRQRVTSANGILPSNANSHGVSRNAAMFASYKPLNASQFDLPLRFSDGAAACSYQNFQEQRAAFMAGFSEGDEYIPSMYLDAELPLDAHSDPSVGSPPMKVANGYEDLPDCSVPPMPGSYDYGTLARATFSGSRKEYDVAEHNGVKLRDLSEHEQILQERYFNITNPEAAIHCLGCGVRGHMEESCPESQCQHCDIVGEHFSFACPTFERCARCRERGHKISECRSTNSKAVIDDLCDICGLAGHLEEECAALWRTRYPDTSKVRKMSVSEMVVGCYSCGSEEHWGDDCPKSSTILKWMKRDGGPSIWSAAFASTFVEGGDYVAWVRQGRREQATGRKGTQDVIADGRQRPNGGYDYQLAMLDGMRD